MEDKAHIAPTEREPDGSLFLCEEETVHPDLIKQLTDFISDNGDLIKEPTVLIGRFNCENIGVFYPVGTNSKKQTVEVIFTPNPTGQFPYTGTWLIRSFEEGEVNATSRFDQFEILARRINLQAKAGSSDFRHWIKPEANIEVDLDDLVGISMLVSAILSSDKLRYLIDNLRRQRKVAARQMVEVLETGQIYLNRGVSGPDDRYPRRPRNPQALGSLLAQLARDVSRGFTPIV